MLGTCCCCCYCRLFSLHFRMFLSLKSACGYAHTLTHKHSLSNKQTNQHTHRTNIEKKDCWKNNKWQMYCGILGAWRKTKGLQILQNAVGLCLFLCFRFYFFCFFSFHVLHFYSNMENGIFSCPLRAKHLSESSGFCRGGQQAICIWLSRCGFNMAQILYGFGRVYHLKTILT